jgi:hypothetical protein
MRLLVVFSQLADEFKIDIPVLFSFYFKLFYIKKYISSYEGPISQDNVA